MKITGFITEYNPFHEGHRYHLEQARAVSGADFTVALMSGSHVQRGEPAVYDKYIRTRMALEGGVDLVLEIPAAFSTASAPDFASFGVAALTALGADALVFGSECGSLEPLCALAQLLEDDPPRLGEAIRRLMKQGLTYPQAQAEAILALENGTDAAAAVRSLLLSPNNILGIEYIRAAIRQKSPLKLYTIRREGSGYHQTALPGQGVFPSASAIRAAIREENRSLPLPSYARAVPPVFPDDYSSFLNYRLLSGGWQGIAELTPELEARLARQVLPPRTFTERVQALKGRQITYTRASRALLHLILDIRSEQLDQWKAAGYAPYARILGFRKESAPLLSQLKKRSSIPLLTKMADAPALLSAPALAMLEQEVRAAHLYQTVCREKGAEFKNEYTEGVLIL